jgi:hypothetical protein
MKSRRTRSQQAGLRGTVEIESEWTASERGWQLPERMGSRISSPVPKSDVKYHDILYSALSGHPLQVCC